MARKRQIKNMISYKIKTDSKTMKKIKVIFKLRISENTNTNKTT